MPKDGVKKNILNGKINFNLRFYFNNYNRVYYKNKRKE